MIIMEDINIQNLEQDIKYEPSLVFAKLLMERATAHIVCHRYDNAEGLCVEALNIIEKTCGQWSEEYSTALLMFASIYYHKGFDAIAFKFIMQAFESHFRTT